MEEELHLLRAIEQQNGEALYRRDVAVVGVKNGSTTTDQPLNISH